MRPVLVALLLSGSLACDKAQFGLPRTALAAASPDGRFLALVRNHATIDPPDQSLWVGAVGAESHRIEQLFPDMDWCDAIAWSADSSTVAYVIRGARLRVVRAKTAETVFNEWVVEWRGEYPPAITVSDLTLSADGASATFRGCRRTGECSDLTTIDITGRGAGQPAS